MTLRVVVAVIAGATLLLALGAAAPPAASADTTVKVNTTGDVVQAGDGKCSLREATLFANGTAEPNCAPGTPTGTTTIVVPAGMYTLGGQPLTLTGSAALAGAGAATTTIAGAPDALHASQVFVIDAAAHVSISGVTVTHGNSKSDCSGQNCNDINEPVVAGIAGGGIANSGALTLTGVIVSGNRTGPGGQNPVCMAESFGCGAGPGGPGGGISNTGTLTISGSAITGNATGAGGAGAIGDAGRAGGTSGGGGPGGGISNSGTLTITNSTISGNTTGAGGDGPPGGNGSAAPGASPGGFGSAGGAGGFGGGINNIGRLAISGSTISGNTTGAGGHGGNGGAGTGGFQGGDGGLGGDGGAGGGISSTTDMTISNSTITGNTAGTAGPSGFGGSPNGGFPGTLIGANGGGIEQLAMGTTLTHVTVASNRAPGTGGGIDGDGGTITAGNSIIASNQAGTGQNCNGVITDQGRNVEFGASSCPGGFLNADPRLAPLANNGGPTQTIALRPGSSAIQHVRTCVLGRDQRGVRRPVGAACDSGAYEVASPGVSGVSAGAVATTSATITANVNPNLQDTKVLVHFGRTPSYGSSTAATDLGAGNADGPFSATLSGLVPGVTYHFAVVATNADGQTTTSDGTFTTLGPLTASVARATTTGPALSLTIACAGGSGPGRCVGTIRLTSKAPSKAAHIAKGKHRKRAKPLTVASGSYSVASGSSARVKISLNRTGRTMLTQQYVLAATISLRGTTQVTRKVMFRYPVITSLITWSISFRAGASAATLSQLSARGVPHGGRVTVDCRGGGCPFSARGFAPRGGQVAVGAIFSHRLLQLGATVRIEVLAPNQVGKVDILGIRSGQTVSVSKLCLPPGAARPARCVHAPH